MNPAYTQSLNKLIDELAKLPGIGTKTAERLAFHILRTEKNEALLLTDAITKLKNSIKQCKQCHNLSESDLCSICRDAKRDKSIICVVEQFKDLIALEKTGLCKWVYHVLGGHIAPLDGIEPQDLTIEHLIERVRVGKVGEVVMATNPTVEGDGTALYISSLIKPMGIKVTRLARGLPGGSQIEYAGGAVLTDAILGRCELE
ncbi:MAG: recombination mediator RecR [Planctomycetes bacterium]|nr:recombination mediator RecR [Planctomycetota bacterium]MBU1518042.1 recombination mediator RecR [Planctomycetota bacterium]MBU2458200.1 recombination mediator RecR [Planctomycetota bacterium]MBU2596002.1 recombination mediator RecR [Planctomycetota bacterium]